MLVHAGGNSGSFIGPGISGIVKKSLYLPKLRRGVSSLERVRRPPAENLAGRLLF